MTRKTLVLSAVLGWVAGSVAPSVAQPVVFEDLHIQEPTPNQFALFGRELDLDNGVMLVSASSTGSGRAYLFDAQSGALLHQLIPTGGFVDAFGSGVSIGGGVAAVGATLSDVRGQTSGAAFLFDSSTGAHITRLLAPDTDQGDFFGWDVAIDDGLVAVSAVNAGDPASGKVYVFDLVTHELVHEFRLPEPSVWDNFGNTMAFRDGYLAVGTDRYIPDLNEVPDAVYIYDVKTGELIREIAPPMEQGGIALCLEIHNDTLLVGTFQGGAVLYDIPSGAIIDTLLPSGLTPSDQDVRSIDMNDEFIALGMAFADVDGASGVGATYIYDAGTRAPYAKLLASEHGGTDFFGNAVALEGRTIAIGADRADLPEKSLFSVGAAYRFDLDACSPVDLAPPEGVIDVSDVTAFLTAFSSADPTADMAEPTGELDFDDVLAFLSAFGVGCP